MRLAGIVATIRSILELDNIEEMAELAHYRTNGFYYVNARKTTSVIDFADPLISRPLTSAMFAPSVSLVEKTFHFISSSLATLFISIFVFGFAVGPLIIAPLSETYDRQPDHIVSTFFFVICQLACALSTNVGMLLAFRFLAGCCRIDSCDDWWCHNWRYVSKGKPRRSDGRIGDGRSTWSYVRTCHRRVPLSGQALEMGILTFDHRVGCNCYDEHALPLGNIPSCNPRAKDSTTGS